MPDVRQRRKGAEEADASTSAAASSGPAPVARAKPRVPRLGRAVLQQQVLRQQDESLDSLQSAVGRLKQMGQTIGDELETQNHMLDGMEGQVDAAANAMSTLKAKMKQLANNKEGGKLCAIAALSATLFVLMYLVVND